MSLAINEPIIVTTLFRRDIVFPGELFPDKTQQNIADKLKKNKVFVNDPIKEIDSEEDEDLKPGVMTRW